VIRKLGTSVAISGDTIVAGAQYGGSMSQGSAYVFVRSGGVWSRQQILESAGYQFGASVAISGETVVAGAPYGGSMSQGSAYVFVRSGGCGASLQMLESVGYQFGASVAISGVYDCRRRPCGGSMSQGLPMSVLSLTPADDHAQSSISLWPTGHDYRTCPEQDGAERERRRGWQPHQ
jgi:hypothetical protein